MTLFDEQTDLLPAPPRVEDPESARSGTGALLALLVGIVVVLLVTGVFIAETLGRAEAERTFADRVRNALAIPDSERVEVDIAGSVLLQDLVRRVDRAAFTVYSYPMGRSNVDMTFTVEGVHEADGDWTADRASGAMTLSAAQATAMFLPAEAQGAMRIGFSDGDMTIGATTAPAMVAAVTPRFENGRFTMDLASVTVGDKILSSDELAALTGADPAALHPAPVCLAEAAPRFLHLNDVRVADQRLRMEFDVDIAAFKTAAGREPGSCP